MIETVILVVIAVLGLSSALAVGMIMGLRFRGFQAPDAPIIPITRRPKERRKPKFVSEEEQWRKEQLRPPSDPGLEG